MSAGRSPRGDAHVRASGKHQHVVLFILYVEAFLEYVSVEIFKQRPGGRIGGLWIVNLFVVRLVGISGHAKVMFRLGRVGTIILPVVPNRDRNSVRGVGEKLARENFTLAVFRHTAPGGRVTPFTRDDRNLSTICPCRPTRYRRWF